MLANSRRVLATVAAMVLLAVLMAALAIVVVPSGTAGFATQSAGAAVTGPECQVPTPVPPPASPRIRHVRAGGYHASVLLPPGYFSGHTHYPVLYLLHGGTSDVDAFLVGTHLIAETGALRPAQQFIVVTPFGDSFGFYSNWHDGSHAYGGKYMTTVVADIDRMFRTIPKRTARAVAGISMGGFGAMNYAGRLPALFAYAASISGFVDIQDPAAVGLVEAGVFGQRHCVDGLLPGQYDQFGLFGNPVTDSATWSDANPTANPARLAGLRDLWITDSSGPPCDPQDVQDAAAVALETVVHRLTRNLESALRSAGVRHSFNSRDCGTHSARYFDMRVTEYVRRLAARWGP